MDMKKVYKQLTGVDIDDQKQIWFSQGDERAKGYYGEYLVFCELYKYVKGNCKILMNLNVPTGDGKTTEIDLLLIHETGLYVFEIKNYKGTIYGNGNDNIWTQYFRTVKNNVFKNPILQNEYHIKAIKNMFRGIPINSFIVFTDPDCDIRVKDINSDIAVCTLSNLNRVLNYRISSIQQKYSMEEIDTIFNELSKYSSMQEVVEINGEAAPFISWLNPIISKLEEEKKKYIEYSNQQKKNMYIGIIINVVVAILCIVFAIFSINTIKSNYVAKINEAQNNYNLELNKFKQNFKHVDEIGNEYVDKLNEYVKVSNIYITKLSDNAVSFSAELSMNNDIYGALLTENSKYIVMTTDGKVLEYDVFGKHLYYNYFGYMFGKSVREHLKLEKAQFYGVNKADISYIKITNIELFKLDMTRTKVRDNLELELYSK